MLSSGTTMVLLVTSGLHKTVKIGINLSIPLIKNYTNFKIYEVDPTVSKEPFEILIHDELFHESEFNLETFKRLIYIENHWQTFRMRFLKTNELLRWSADQQINLKLISRRYQIKYKDPITNKNGQRQFWKIFFSFDNAVDAMTFYMTWR